ncbi:hypothetical protein, partial [Enterococcus pallens]
KSILTIEWDKRSLNRKQRHLIIIPLSEEKATLRTRTVTQIRTVTRTPTAIQIPIVTQIRTAIRTRTAIQILIVTQIRTEDEVDSDYRVGQAIAEPEAKTFDHYSFVRREGDTAAGANGSSVITYIYEG